jgi:hypothetical protein
MQNKAIEELKAAFCRNDAAAVRNGLARHPELLKLINEPIGAFDSPPIVGARSREMLDVLLEAGADINGRSRWWAGSFGLLDSASDDLAAYAISRGAVVDAHAAARLGMMDRLRELVAVDPKVVHARGGDGKMPLHFARTVEIAEFLLSKDADIDARDIDHESTAAQHLIQERTDVARYLVGRGSWTDIFLAAALGDLARVKKHLAENPECVRQRVDRENFPMRHPRAGGTIYQWTLGANVSPHQVARKFGHEDVLRILMEASPPSVRLVNACWLKDRSEMERLLKIDPGAAKQISGADQRALADAARESALEVVKLMLDAGISLESRGQHGGSALHWAAWRGNLPLVELLLRAGAAKLLEVEDLDFQANPLGWAIHASENGWDIETGDYAGVVKALLAAGSKRPKEIGGSAAVRAALQG